MSKYKTTNIEDTEMIYSILRDSYPNRQIEIEYNDNTKEYILNLTNNEFKEDPEVPIDIKIKVVYGDSVTGDTPLLLKKNNQIYIETIQSIFNESKKFEYPGFKLFNKDIRLEKEYSLSDYQIWCDNGWVDIKKVIRHKCDKKIYRVLTHTGCIDVTEDHSLINSNLEPVKPGELKIGDSLSHTFPTEFTENKETIVNSEQYDNNDNIISNYILNATKEIKLAYLHGFLAAQKCNKNYSFVIESKIVTQRMYYLMRSIGIDVSINHYYDPKKMDIYFIDEIKNKDDVDCTLVKKIIEKEPQNDYVYDIETTIGRFGAGVGQLQTLNTDSVFLSLKYNRQDFTKNRWDTFNLATVCGDNLTEQVFNRKPIEMEFEKVFQPFILLTKKRYIGKKYENMKDPFKLKEITKSGIAITRRDYCKMVKNCYSEVIDCIVNENTDGVEQSIEIYKSYIDKIDNYQINIEDLVVSAMLAKSYKTKPVHVHLAEKLKERFEEVQVGDRIPYIYIESNDPTIQKSELGEDPKYAIEHNLKFNRKCYLEQLAKPLLGFFKCVLHDNEEALDDIINYTNDKLVEYGGTKLKPSEYKMKEDS
jgi:hypothetical protein